MTAKMKHETGERPNICFNRKIKLKFHGFKLTSDGNLLAYLEFDELSGLFESVFTVMNKR